MALARMLRIKWPDIGAVFIARQENRRIADGIGTFLPLPLDPQVLQQAVAGLLTARDQS